MLARASRSMVTVDVSSYAKKKTPSEKEIGNGERQIKEKMKVLSEQVSETQKEETT